MEGEHHEEIRSTLGPHSLSWRVRWRASKDEKETIASKMRIVLKEIMDIPDDIPQDLMTRPECVIIYPSVVKGRLSWRQLRAVARWSAEPVNFTVVERTDDDGPRRR